MGKPKRPRRDPRPRPLISLCMIARDEERFIGRALASVDGLADEMVVVDTGSTDRTVEIARSHGARVYEIPWPNDFSKARNRSIAHARGQWILVLDADEEFPPEHAQRLRALLEHLDAPCAAVQISQANVASVDDRRILDSGRTVRIFRNRPEHRYMSPIHEQIVPNLQGPVLSTDIFVWHYGFLQEVVQGKNKIERNVRMLEEFLPTLGPSDPFRYYVLMQIGREHQRMGRPEDAYRYYSQALEASEGEAAGMPFIAALAVYHTENLLVLGRNEEALAFSLRSLDRFPWSADLWFFQGIAELNLQRTADGIVHLLWSSTVADVRKADQEFYAPSRSLVAWRNAVIALIRLGAPEAALQLALEALRSAPQDMELTRLAVACLRAKPELVHHVGGRAHPGALDSILRGLFLEGQADLLLTLAQAMAGAHGPGPESRFWAAAALLCRGEYARAAGHLEGVALEGDIGAYAQIARVVSLCGSGQRPVVEGALDGAPHDLFHTLQRDFAGIPLGEFPENYAAYRQSFEPMFRLWPRDYLAAEGDAAIG